MNPVIEQLKLHRSIRKYKPDALSDEHLQSILESAQKASTSSNMQAYSIVGVTDPEAKKRLAHLAADQQFIEECPLFLIWCADLLRLQHACAPIEEVDIPSTSEIFIIATVDTALAAQNASIAAESLGLGVVYVGGIRNNPKEVSEVIGLPKLVYPVFGMCVGYPDQEPTQRPRLPLEVVYHKETYSTNTYTQGIEDYNRSLSEFMLTRAGGTRDSNWSKEMVRRLNSRHRTHMREFLAEQGFELN
ncbi:oxygen-insensitive NADPH nitroreductase [Paenibacillus sp. 5J-6]|uniref:Oxygen-insensitive NADPH nitroreductase n=1 Tax=Paenibacillus silvestris TaxID=2606219 RepID=A0A6L8V7J8_9BACL|nr:oxygen-insensitive NADPH nitroreductase [Paenibacillus silvestris]MZQ85299.1 oxygen-insensitive NADPH nitroreductase [Paenibacillus silvestris]